MRCESLRAGEEKFIDDSTTLDMFDGMLNLLILHTVDKYLNGTALHPPRPSITKYKADIGDYRRKNKKGAGYE